VVAFGQILPPEVLAQPPLGCWNAHGSLLPRWRGAAPIQWCLLEGDRETGVGIMAMEAGLDTGPVLLERSLAIDPLENARQLGQRLAMLSAELLVEALPRIEAAGTGPEAERLARLGVRPQGAAGLSVARLLTKADAVIDWSAAAVAIHRRVMGLYPNAHTSWRGKRLKLLASEPLVAGFEGIKLEGIKLGGAMPGTVLAIEPGVGLVLASGAGPLLLREAQLEGRAPALGQALIQQLGAGPGDRFGSAPGLLDGANPA
jgi:methionyl-tRNA formyltransferase